MLIRRLAIAKINGMETINENDGRLSGRCRSTTDRVSTDAASLNRQTGGRECARARCREFLSRSNGNEPTEFGYFGRFALYRLSFRPPPFSIQPLSTTIIMCIIFDLFHWFVQQWVSAVRDAEVQECTT